MTLREWQVEQAIIANVEMIAWFEDVSFTELLLCLSETDLTYLKKSLY